MISTLPGSPKAGRPGRFAPASRLVLPISGASHAPGSAPPVRSTKAGKDLRTLSLNGRQLVRVEPQQGEDRRRDLGGLDPFGLDLNRDTRAADNHQDVTVADVHTAVLGKLGRSRVDDALLDLAEDVRVVTVADRDSEELGGVSAGPDLSEARVPDGDGVLVDVVTLSGVVPQVALDEVASCLRVVRQIDCPRSSSVPATI